MYRIFEQVYRIFELEIVFIGKNSYKEYVFIIIIQESFNTCFYFHEINLVLFFATF